MGEPSQDTALRLLTFARAGEVRVGALRGDRVLDLNRTDPAIPRAMPDLVRAGEPALALARRAVARLGAEWAGREAELARDGVVHALGDVEVLAPIPFPERGVFCVGRNYFKHLAESARARGEEFKALEHPEFFSKPPATVVGTEARFALDARITERLDYEVELAVVIGRQGRDIPRERAYEHVFGYTVANDLSARDQQRRHGQWFKGKALDASCPLGPVVVPHADVGDPHALAIRLRVNGETRQDANTGEMSFGVAEVLHWLSQGTTLEPGDVVLMGTPDGVGNAMKPPRYLRPGDVVEAEIERIGVLRTYIVAGAH